MEKSTPIFRRASVNCAPTTTNGWRACAVEGPAPGVTAADMVARFWGDRLSPHEVRFALVEIAAHLEHLRLKGDLAVAAADGVDRYRSG